MKSKIWRILSYVMVAVTASALTLALTAGTGGSRKLEQLEKLLLERFVDGVDKKDLEDGAANGMIEALGDRWSYYIPADEYASYVENKNNAYVGIGVSIHATEDGYEITKVNEGGPAEEAGLLAGDLMTKVDGKSVAGMDTDEGKKLVQGKEGTKVNITVLRSGVEQTFEVTRRTVKNKVAIASMLPDNIGLIRIVNFNTSCYDETVAAIESLMNEGATSLIFDVRFNPGGYVRELVKLLDYLLPEGVIFRSEDYKGRVETKVSDAEYLDIPMAVLVNGSSYSAAEFFAAALEEYDAAVIVGEKTTGKGHFQNTFELVDGSAVGISTGKYYTPKGVSLEGVGLTPEFFVEVDKETAAGIYAGTLAPDRDPQIIAAINALKSGK